MIRINRFVLKFTINAVGRPKTNFKLFTLEFAFYIRLPCLRAAGFDAFKSLIFKYEQIRIIAKLQTQSV
jgi:hypothetical protein